MPILVKLSSTLRTYVPGYDPAKGLSLPMSEGLTAARVIESLGVPLAMVKILMVNGVHAPLDRPLADGDRLGVFPAVGGG